MKATLISASAGSGKTWILTNALFNKIQAGAIEPQQVIAVTFTRAAADEMRERMRRTLFEHGCHDAAHGIEGALVGTVDSVCERLLKRFAFEAGISPDFAVIPEEEASLFFNESLSSILHALPTHEISRFAASLMRFGVEKVSDQLRNVETIARLARQNLINPNDLHKMAEDSITSYLELLPTPLKSDGAEIDGMMRNKLVEAIQRIKSKIKNSIDVTKETEKYYHQLEKFHSALSQGAAQWDSWAYFEHTEPAKNSKNDCEMVKQAAESHLSHPQFHKDVKTIIRMSFTLAAEAIASYDEWKRQRGLIDFIDMEEKVLQLLEHDHVVQTIQSEYRILMVDEFQDTSPIQLALFTRLGRAVGEIVWVGDRKQCIYGFRDSDPELMASVFNSLAQGAAVSYLESSWRSRPPLVSFFNNIFTRTFKRHGFHEREVKLKAERQERSELPPPIEIWMLDSQKKDDDFELTARGIVRLLQAGPDLQIEDPISGGLRRVRPGDIAVLERTNEECAIMADKLCALGVHASVGRVGLMNTMEGVFLSQACEIVLDRFASLPSLVMLHLATGGSLENLINDRIENVKRDTETNAIAWPDEPLLRRLRDLSDEARFLSPSELFDRVIEASGIRDLCLRWGAASFRLGNIDRIRAYARQYEETCGFRGTAATFLGLYLYLASLEDGGDQSSLATPDAVTVTTYHKAKGLEWPVVIHGNLAKDLRKGICVSTPTVFSSSNSFDAANPLSGRFIHFWPWPYQPNRKKTTLYAGMKAHPLEKRAEERAYREEQRLAYVGFTRSRDLLVLPVRRSSGTNPPLRLALLEANLNLPQTDENGVIAHDFGLGESYQTRVRQLSMKDEARLIQSAAQTWFARPEGEAPSYGKRKVYASSIPAGSNAQVTRVYSFGRRIEGLFETSDDPSLGNAIHAFYAADDPDLPREERVGMATDLLAVHNQRCMLNPEELVASADRLMSFIRNEWPGGAAWKELPIRLLRQGREVAGVADLVVERENEFFLIDHKSFPGSTEQCRKRALEYEDQIEAYAEELEKATGKRCAGMAVHFPIAGLIVWIGCNGNKNR